MLDKVKISIDVMGGDNSPDKTLDGLNLFIKEIRTLVIIFFIYLGIKQLLIRN